MNRQETIEKLALYTAVDNDSGCWNWTGGRDNKGYGRMSVGSGQKIAAHRAAFSSHNNVEIPSHMLVMHLCDNRVCVNPDHLVMGSHKANMLDMKQKGRAARGSKHPLSKIAEEDIAEIMELAEKGWFNDDIAKKFGVSRGTIHKIVTGRTYKAATS